MIMRCATRSVCTPSIAIHRRLQVADNSWNAGTANSNDSAAGCAFSPSGVCYSDRKFAAVRAYHEWIPIRQVEVDDRLRIWRNFEVGKLMVSIVQHSN